MKRIIAIIISIILLSYSSRAQIAKNTWLIGGSVNFSSTKYKTDAGPKNQDYDLQANPNIGYFIIDKFAAGLKSSIGTNGVKGQSTDGYTKYTDFNLGPFIRYYILPDSKPFNVLLEGAYEYGFIKGDNDDLKKNTFILSTGAVMFFTESVGIEFLLGYSTFKFNEFEGYSNSLRLGLGVQVHLSKE